jgi:hypothetical protein
MISVTVKRYQSEKDWTLSEFFILGAFYGYGIEDELRTQKVHGETRIPNGVYELALTHSPRFSKDYFVSNRIPEISRVQNAEFQTPHKLITVLNVPNFSRILWHWGNTDDDTDGCYIVGSTIGDIKGQKAVLSSRKKYEQIYPVISSIIRSNASKGIKTHVEYKDKIQTNIIT